MTTTYPTRGPGLRITSLPADNRHRIANSAGSAGSSRLRMAIGDLVIDDTYPHLRATRECDGGDLICRDAAHFGACAAELDEIGATYEALGEMRLVRTHDGDVATVV